MAWGHSALVLADNSNMLRSSILPGSSPGCLESNRSQTIANYEKAAGLLLQCHYVFLHDKNPDSGFFPESLVEANKKLKRLGYFLTMDPHDPSQPFWKSETFIYSNISSYATLTLISYDSQRALTRLDCQAICQVEVSLFKSPYNSQSEQKEFFCRKNTSRSIEFNSLEEGKVYEIKMVVSLMSSSHHYPVSILGEKLQFWAIDNI